jgi:uncharacterized protein (UPF0303 family)
MLMLMGCKMEQTNTNPRVAKLLQDYEEYKAKGGK